MTHRWRILSLLRDQMSCLTNLLLRAVILRKRTLDEIFRRASISWFEVVSRWVIDIFTASASTGLSDYFSWNRTSHSMNKKLSVSVNGRVSLLFCSKDHLSAGLLGSFGLPHRVSRLWSIDCKCCRWWHLNIWNNWWWHLKRRFK